MHLKAPLDTQIEVTVACPHACRHCYNYWRTDPKHPPVILSEQHGRDIVGRLADAGVFNIILTGGEPLLNLPTCLASIQSARGHGMRVMMNSNLVALSEKSALSLRRAGLDHILTSICGPDGALYDHITQPPASPRRLKRMVPRLDLEHTVRSDALPNGTMAPARRGTG